MGEKFFQEMVEKWPSTIVTRTEAKRFTGGLIGEKYLANLDCTGQGPEGRFRCGRKVCYPANNLAEWLESRCTAIENKRKRKSK